VNKKDVKERGKREMEITILIRDVNERCERDVKKKCEHVKKYLSIAQTAKQTDLLFLSPRHRNRSLETNSNNKHFFIPSLSHLSHLLFSLFCSFCLRDWHKQHLHTGEMLRQSVDSRKLQKTKENIKKKSKRTPINKKKERNQHFISHINKKTKSVDCFFFSIFCFSCFFFFLVYGSVPANGDECLDSPSQHRPRRRCLKNTKKKKKKSIRTN
jgi:hypothetical protein